MGAVYFARMLPLRPRPDRICGQTNSQQDHKNKQIVHKSPSIANSNFTPETAEMINEMIKSSQANYGFSLACKSMLHDNRNFRGPSGFYNPYLAVTNAMNDH
jgi:hypothetical protein